MNLAAWILGFFWIGLLCVAVISWAVNRTFRQIQDIEMIELDELDKDNIQ